MEYILTVLGIVLLAFIDVTWGYGIIWIMKAVGLKKAAWWIEGRRTPNDRPPRLG